MFRQPICCFIKDGAEQRKAWSRLTLSLTVQSSPFIICDLNWQLKNFGRGTICSCKHLQFRHFDALREADQVDFQLNSLIWINRVSISNKSIGQVCAFFNLNIDIDGYWSFIANRTSECHRFSQIQLRDRGVTSCREYGFMHIWIVGICVSTIPDCKSLSGVVKTVTIAIFSGCEGCHHHQ